LRLAAAITARFLRFGWPGHLSPSKPAGPTS
jgi:hypothetical protein